MVAAVFLAAERAVRPVVVAARLAVVAVARADFLADVAVPLAPAFAAFGRPARTDRAVTRVSPPVTHALHPGDDLTRFG